MRRLRQWRREARSSTVCDRHPTSQPEPPGTDGSHATGTVCASPQAATVQVPSATRPATRAGAPGAAGRELRSGSRPEARLPQPVDQQRLQSRPALRAVPGLPRPVTRVTLSRSENSTDVPSASPRARPISAPLARSRAASDPIRSLRSTRCRTRPRTRLVQTVRCGYPARRSPSLYAHTRQAVTRVGAAIRARLESSRAEARIEGIYAFGSRVRGDHRGESDLDLLVVVAERGPEVVRAVVDSCVEEELRSGIPFDPVIAAELQLPSSGSARSRRRCRR